MVGTYMHHNRHYIGLVFRIPFLLKLSDPYFLLLLSDPYMFTFTILVRYWHLNYHFLTST
jgi:hypothetical protein